MKCKYCFQAAAANPAAAAAGYPSNLLPPPHMDPVYQLMQQSGMHTGQVGSIFIFLPPTEDLGVEENFET